MTLPAQRNVQTCGVCVMDATTPGVSFDEAGQCNCCRSAIARMPLEWWPGKEGQAKLDKLIARLKNEGRGKPYDAMIGLSGGIDSAYLAHVLSADYGLRCLAVHVDAGWNSAAAVTNIESLIRKTGFDLHTVVIEWDEVRDVQLAFLKSGVYNQDFPQDHAFFTTLMRTANRFKVKSFLSGVNFSSESVEVPAAPNPTAFDGKHLRAIHDRFGERPLRAFPTMTLREYLVSTRLRGRPVVYKPLNYLPYNKEEAKKVLRREYGWRDYGAKHSESRFTKFYQDIYLPKKYFMDKRRLHESSLIVAGQRSRTEALDVLATPIAAEDQAERDMRFVAKKLRISRETLDDLIHAPAIPHSEYPSDLAMQHRLIDLQHRVRRIAERAKG